MVEAFHYRQRASISKPEVLHYLPESLHYPPEGLSFHSTLNEFKGIFKQSFCHSTKVQAVFWWMFRRTVEKWNYADNAIVFDVKLFNNKLNNEPQMVIL